MSDRKLLCSAAGVLVLESLLLPVFPNMVLAAILLLISMILFAAAVFRNHGYLCWIPLAALIAEIDLFYLSASGALLIFYYILLIVNLAFLFAARKRTPSDQLLDAALIGKICLLPLEGINAWLGFTTGVPMFFSIAYTMVLITSFYDIAGLFARIDRPGMTPRKFLVPSGLLLIPVIDLVISFLLAYRERKAA